MADPDNNNKKTDDSRAAKIERVTADFDTLQAAIASARVRDDFDLVKKAKSGGKPVKPGLDTPDLRDYLFAVGNSRLTFSHPEHRDTEKYTRHVKENASDLAGASHSLERQQKETGTPPREDQREDLIKKAQKVFAQQPEVLDSVV